MKSKSKVVEVRKCNIENVDLVRLKKLGEDLVKAVDDGRGSDIKHILECFRYYQYRDHNSRGPTCTSSLLLLPTKGRIQARPQRSDAQPQHDARRRDKRRSVHRGTAKTAKKETHKATQNRKRGRR